nr:uncharacterized protein LOC107281003 [Oryza sativa Japonica Group]
MDHLSAFKEIVADLESMEVKYDEEDLGLILLCSLPSSYANFRDTILYSRDTLTLKEVYDALHAKEKMKKMVPSEGSNSQAEGLVVRGRQQEKNTNNKSRDKSSSIYRGRSKSRGRYKSCKYCKRDGHDISECWKLQDKDKRTRKYIPKGKKEEEGKAAVVTDEKSDAELLVAYAGCAQTSDQWILDTACTYHMCPNRDWFATYEAVQGGTVLMGDDTPCEVAELSKRGLLDGQSIGKLKFCEHCIFGKHKRVKFNTSTHTTEVWPYFLKHKYQAFDVFKEWKTMVERQTERKEKVSVQVEHLISSGHAPEKEDVAINQDAPVIEDSDSSIVQQSPKRSIAKDRPKRNTKPPRRYIEEANIVAYALSVAEEIEGNAEPSTYSDAIVSDDCNRWITAMHDEMESLEKNHSWELEKLPKEKKPIRCKWIFKRKEGMSPSDEARYKARLVAKGYSQIPGIDFNDVFSPVVKHSSIRTLLSIVAMHDYELEQMDVKTAFLHGELEEDIYMEQPEGFVVPGKENLVCRLKKSLYGLKQSPRQWYKRFDSFMLSQKFRRSNYDSCVYLKVVDGSAIYLLLYVDDMLIAAKDKSEIAKLKAQLSSEFEMKDLGAAKKILDFAGDLDRRRSLTGYVFTVGGCAVSWKSKCNMPYKGSDVP